MREYDDDYTGYDVVPEEKFPLIDTYSSIKRVSAPMFTIKGEQYNEYEIRQLMIDVANKEIVFNSDIIDCNGGIAQILPDGRLSNELEGFNLSDKMALELYMLVFRV
jgi:hypothetical protein